MYLMSTDTYVCDICGFEGKFDTDNDIHGELWGCERCGDTFCSKCFIDRMGEEDYWKMMRDSDLIMCPICYAKEKKNVSSNTRPDPR
jgi:hypothetical protein